MGCNPQAATSSLKSPHRLGILDADGGLSQVLPLMAANVLVADFINNNMTLITWVGILKPF